GDGATGRNGEERHQETRRRRKEKQRDTDCNQDPRQQAGSERAGHQHGDAEALVDESPVKDVVRKKRSNAIVSDVRCERRQKRGYRIGGENQIADEEDRTNRQTRKQATMFSCEQKRDKCQRKKRVFCEKACSNRGGYGRRV